MKKNLNNLGIKVSIITVLINFFLFAFKLIAGIIAHSHAIISDAFHSLSDVVSTFAVIFGLFYASKDADESHPYGHERIESVMAVILSFMLFLTGIGIGYIGINNIMSSTLLKIPGRFALVAAVISIIIKEGMYHYTMWAAKKLNSPSMKADAWHHRSDAFSSIGSFIGILGARLGLTVLDPLCSILIAILIVKSALDIFATSINQMVDKSCDEEVNEKIKDFIKSLNKNVVINEFKTRMFGSKVYIDTELAIDGNMKLDDANEVVLYIHDNLEKQFAFIKHCNIHIVPKK